MRSNKPARLKKKILVYASIFSFVFILISIFISTLYPNLLYSSSFLSLLELPHTPKSLYPPNVQFPELSLVNATVNATKSYARSYSILITPILTSDEKEYNQTQEDISQAQDSVVVDDIDQDRIWTNEKLEKQDIIAESALVMDYKTGDILWEKNSTRKMFPASLTKIMTSIIAIENTKNLDELVEISKNASGKNHSLFRFRTGDKISVLDLIKASLICSHNNATIALAEHISGSEEEFVKLMNLKAKEIGAQDTNFQNTNGLDSNLPYHKTTAKDLAIITSYCLKNNLFRKIVNTTKDYISINGKEIEISNTNGLLPYSYIKGVKTGYTENAGFCIILYSEKNDIEVITVILNSSQEGRNEDSLKLLNWVYNNFEYQKIVDSTKIFKTEEIGKYNIVTVDLYPESDYQRLVNKNSDLINFDYEVKNDIEPPIYKDQVLGKVKIYINGIDEAEKNLVSKEDIEKPYIYQELSNQKETQSQRILIFLLAFYFFIFTLIIIRNLRRGRNYY